VIKIADFGNAEVFQEQFSHYKHKSQKRGGTEPYMAPEIFKDGELDVQAIDIWACGIIFITFYYQRWPWEKATNDDALFNKFLQGKHTMLQAIPAYIAECILGMLEINPDKRITLKQIYKNEWFNSLSKA
jgi:serine/threonine protein kinase